MSISPSASLPVYQMPWLEGEKGGSIRIVTSKAKPLPLREIWLSPHRKDYYMLEYVKEGSGRHWVDTIPYEFTADTLYFSSPEQVQAKEDVKLVGTVITFTSEFLALEQNAGLARLPLLQNRQNAHDLRMQGNDKSEFESILERCLNEYQHDADLQTEMLCAQVRVLLVFLSRIYNVQYNENGPNEQRLLYRRFRDCLEAHYKKSHKARKYNNMMHLSTSHLNALLKEQSGKTVTTHIHQRLILEAKRMLFHTDLTIKQIAFELGFHDTSYFSRFFKKGNVPYALGIPAADQQIVPLFPKRVP